MIIACPKCDQTHNVDLAKISCRKFYASCKTCKFKFIINIVTCPSCGNTQLDDDLCNGCGALLRAGEEGPEKDATGRTEKMEAIAEPDPETEAPLLSPEKPPPAADTTAPPASHRFKPEFTGNAGEFFRIWIVNLFLTIITFGIYAAWAKVRTRKYFYANTRLAGHSFDYTADPMAILKGNLIVGGGFLIYILAGNFSPVLSGVAVIVFAVIFPFLIFKSLRFFARNSVFRNIRFRFMGSLKESYKTYLLFPALIPLTLGLFMPYWAFCQKKYFYDNIAFGSSPNEFSGGAKTFYKVYGIAFLFIVAPMFFMIGMAVGIPQYFAATTVSPLSAEPLKTGIVAAMFAIYLGMMVAVTFIQQYLFVRLSNYCWDVSQLGKIRFESTLKVKSLLWIRITNILAMVFSFGLLTPWAKIRRTRYILDNLSVTADQGLDDFMALAESDESAIGEAATDFFDFEIGL